MVSSPSEYATVNDQQLITVSIDGEPVAKKIIVCNTKKSRRRGLLERDALGLSEGILLISPRTRPSWPLMNAIHMFGMKFKIAIIWLDENFLVVDKSLASPGKMYWPAKQAKHTLEVHPGTFEKFAIGKTICLRVSGSR